MKIRYERSLATKTKRIRAGSMGELVRFSQRVHGQLELCRGTIRNERDKLGRNRVLRINGSAPLKFKRSPVNRLLIPSQVVR